MNAVFPAYCAGLLIVTNFMLVWKGTSFPVHLFNRKDAEDLNDYWQLELGVVGDLLSCVICLSHWVSLAVSFAIFCVFSLPEWFIPLGIFTWPLLCFIILKKIGIV